LILENVLLKYFYMYDFLRGKLWKSNNLHRYLF